MKLNNKAFAASTILYGALTITLLLLMLILATMRSSSQLNKNISEKVEDSLNKCVNINVVLQECRLANDNCSDEAEEYRDCIEQAVVNDNG